MKVILVSSDVFNVFIFYKIFAHKQRWNYSPRNLIMTFAFYTYTTTSVYHCVLMYIHANTKIFLFTQTTNSPQDLGHI